MIELDHLIIINKHTHTLTFMFKLLKKKNKIKSVKKTKHFHKTIIIFITHANVKRQVKITKTYYGVLQKFINAHVIREE